MKKRDEILARWLQAFRRIHVNDERLTDPIPWIKYIVAPPRANDFFTFTIASRVREEKEKKRKWKSKGFERT